MRRTWAASWVVPVEGPPIRDGAVTVEDGRILAVGPAGDPDLVPDAFHDGCVITPGLVNAHAHLEYGASFADLATSGLPFPQWIAELTRRRYAFSAEEWAAEAADGCARSTAAGVTSVADIVTTGPGLFEVARFGLGGVSYLEASGVDDTRWLDRRTRLVELLDTAPAGRRVGISPHTLYTLGTSVFRDLLALARERGLRVHTHLAETAEEAEYVLSGTGLIAAAMTRSGLALELIGAGSGVSPAAHLDELGGLGPDVHVAHGVHLSAADRSLLRRRSSAVALCPRSNRVLGAGVAPSADLLADGACVGTDSLASSPSLSVLDELRELRSAAPAEVLLAAGTVRGARAMGMTDAGYLGVGARGDLAVWRVAGAIEDPVADVLTDAECVETVLFGWPVHSAESAHSVVPA